MDITLTKRIEGRAVNATTGSMSTSIISEMEVDMDALSTAIEIAIEVAIEMEKIIEVETKITIIDARNEVEHTTNSRFRLRTLVN